MTQKSSFLMRFRRVIMFIMILFMFESAVVPAPAHSVIAIIDVMKSVVKWVTEMIEKAKIVMNNTKLGSIIQGIVDLISLFNDVFETLFSTMTKNGQMLSFGQRMQSNIDTKLAQAYDDAQEANMLTAAKMKLAQKLAPPKHEYLCKAVMVQGLVTTSENFSLEISRMMAEAISNRYRCPTCNGMGGDYFKREMRRRDERKYWSVLDNPGAANIASGITGTNGQGLDDADMHMLPPDGSQVFELPIFVRATYTDPITSASVSVLGPEMTNLRNEQEFFIAAWDAVYQEAGPRPTPIGGKSLTTEVGLRQRALFNHCTANQNALIKQCTDAIAYYTRPNYRDSQWDTYRRSQYNKCRALDGIIDLERFTCDGDFANFHGLSMYESEWLAQEMCKTSQNAIAQKMSKARDSDVLSTSDWCTLSWHEWQAQKKRREDNCSEAITALHSLDNCWAAVAAAGGTGAGVNAISTDESVPSATVHKISTGHANDNKSSGQEVNPLMPVKTEPVNMTIPVGKPVLMDQFNFSTAVGQ